MWKRLTEEEFIERAIKVHGSKYDYSIINYERQKKKIKIICPIHGVFEQTPEAHTKMKQGCSACSNNRRLTLDEMENRFINKFGDNLVDFSKAKARNNSELMVLICKVCNKEFIKSYNKLISRGGHYCNYFSKGEKIIENILNINNIDFISQKSFADCINNLEGRRKQRLFFDFFLEKLNIMIEYQGIQHFTPVERFGGFDDFLLRIKNDQIKRNYCISKNIKIIYINYWENNKIEEILKENKIIEL